MDENEESLLSSQGLSPTLRRRRFQRDQKVDQKGGVKLQDATNELVDKHRQIQDALIGEMAMFSEQMKNNSLLMEKSLKDTERVLDSTEEAVEHSLSATNRANLRAGFIYKSSWKTGCFTWLMLFLMCLIFIFMIGVIRMTG
jgi:SNARE protein 1